MLKQASLLAGLTLISPAALAVSFCVPGPDDKPETTLQGGLTVQKRDNTPGGFQGEWCGMRQVGHEPLGLRGSFGDIQLIGLCAYASMRDPSNLALPTTGTSVIDMRVPSAPVWTQTLRTPAMQRAYSALEIQKTTMVAAFKDFGPDNSANNQTDNWFDIYDVSGDCLNPRHLATTSTASGNHDGWLTPDTNFYYGIPFGGQTIQQNPARIDVHVLDMTDKAKPVQLLNWNRLQLPPEVQARTLATRNFHDVSTNDDGTRLYLALYGGNNALGGNPADGSGRCANGLLILDSSDVALRRPNPQLRYISFLSWCPEQQSAGNFVDPDYGDGSTAASHATEYVIHENGRPYILSTDESGAGLDGEWNMHPRQRTFSRLIDISDDANPRVVSTFKPDVNDPDNAIQVATEQINGGMLHYIGFDDRHKMRLVFYAGANQGIRVVDFRVPESPKEIAYYKAPPVATTRTGENDFTRPDPRYDQDNCLVYTGWNQGGLRILELTNPEYNACMRRGVNGGGFLAGTKTNIGFDVGRANGGLGALQGSLQLNDRAADVKINIAQVSYLSGVRDQCGAILPSANAVQFNGSGTFNGAPASFRVCVQDNGEGNKASGPDRFFLTCTAGCSYSANATLGNGNIAVVQR
ncbi:MAG TPA: post-COAP-1 domain-containing protein [Burkholderiales bacterium]|nr:post-COAP-1 domain-containing protein [Burkholderiales bacterium]